MRARTSGGSTKWLTRGSTILPPRINRLHDGAGTGPRESGYQGPSGPGITHRRKRKRVSCYPRHPLCQGQVRPDGRRRRPDHPAAGHALGTDGRPGRPVDVGHRETRRRHRRRRRLQAGGQHRFRRPGHQRAQGLLHRKRSHRRAAGQSGRTGPASKPPKPWASARPASRPWPRRPGPAPAPPTSPSSASHPTASWRRRRVTADTVVIGKTVAKALSLDIGDKASVGGTELTVSAVVEDQWYSHTSVVWTALPAWAKLAHLTDPEQLGTVAAITYKDGATVDEAAANAAAHTVSASRTGSFQALGSYQERERLPDADAGLPLRHLGPGDRGLPDGLDRTADPRHRGPQGHGRPPAAMSCATPSPRPPSSCWPARGLGGGIGILGGFFAAQAAPFLVTPATTLLPIARHHRPRPGRRCRWPSAASPRSTPSSPSAGTKALRAPTGPSAAPPQNPSRAHPQRK